MARDPRASSVERSVTDWNAQHPSGTEVYVTKDDGQVVRTRTQSVAWVLSGHSAVIFLEGISGCYALARVKPVELRDDVH